jgi:FKBP-type peptidyl-prolyl cis-trans isomerase FklB
MRKRTTSMVAFLLAAGSTGTAIGGAQDPSAPKPAPAPAAKTAQAPTAKAPQTGAGKPAQSTAAKRTGGTPLVLKTPKDKASYAIGMNIGRSLHKDAADIDPNIVLRGLKDALAGGKMLLTDDEAKAAIVSIQADMRKKQEAQMAVAGDANKKEGETFLAANKTKDGVVTLADGLQYKILKEGTGPKPSASDSVVCNYRGALIDNTEFDSSYKRGQPATFPVGQVIKGWTEVLQLMPVGSKWQVFVPSELGYGPRGAGGAIGPNATLIFEIELLSIQGK